MDATHITTKCDDHNARVAAAQQADRLQKKVHDLNAQGRHTDAEALTVAWEQADANADTWGATYHALREL